MTTRKRGHSLYRKYFNLNELPTWDEILIDLDNNIEQGKLIKQLDNGGIVTHNGFEINSIQKIGNKIQALRPEDNLSAHIYISLSKNSATFGRHQDKGHDVYFIQALGKTEWLVEDNGEHMYILEPGDMLYISDGLFHTTKPLTPRVGLSLGFEY